MLISLKCNPVQIFVVTRLTDYTFKGITFLFQQIIVLILHCDCVGSPLIGITKIPITMTLYECFVFKSTVVSIHP